MHRAPTISAFLGALLASIAVITGCSDPASHEAARFTAPPKDCRAVATSTESTVRQFAGRLYRDGERFKVADRSPLPPTMLTNWQMCSVSFGDPSLPSDHRSGEEAEYRYASITFTVNSSQDSASATRDAFKRIRDEFRSANITPISLRDEAFTGIETNAGGMRVQTQFRIANLIVGVTTSGENFTGNDGSKTSDSPQLVSDLKSGAESIARSVAEDIDTVMSAQ